MLEMVASMNEKMAEKKRRKSKKGNIIRCISPILENKNKPNAPIDQFEIKEVLGINTYGRIVKAYNKEKERLVALKILSKESIRD